MVARPSNSFNQSSTSAGLQNWDGTATPSTTSLTQYYTLAGASSSTVQNIAPGTSGYVLTSAGASSYPSYQALPYTNMPWTDKAALFTAASQNGYFCTGTFASTMPASPNQGDIIGIVADGSVTVTVTANTGQYIQVGKNRSASAGTAASNFTGDSLLLVYRASDAVWFSIATSGTWTVT